jgi:hypothetical protein
MWTELAVAELCAGAVRGRATGTFDPAVWCLTALLWGGAVGDAGGVKQTRGREPHQMEATP